MSNANFEINIFEKKLDLKQFDSVTSWLKFIYDSSDEKEFDPMIVWKKVEVNLSKKIRDLKYFTKPVIGRCAGIIMGVFMIIVSLSILADNFHAFGLKSSYFCGSVAGVVCSVLCLICMVFPQKLAVRVLNWLKVLLSISATLMALMFAVLAHSSKPEPFQFLIETLLLASFYFIVAWAISFLSTIEYRKNMYDADVLSRSHDFLISAGLLLVNDSELKKLEF